MMGQHLFKALDSLLLIYLIFCAWTDIRTGQICYPPALALALLGAVLHPGFGEWVFGMVPGLALLLLSIVTRQAIGCGDGLVIAACGAILGFYRVLELLLWAFGGAGIAAAVMMIRKRAGGKSWLPLMPFLLAARLLLLITG